MPEINLEEFAQQEGVEFSKVQQLEWLVGWRGCLGEGEYFGMSEIRCV